MWRRFAGLVLLAGAAALPGAAASIALTTGPLGAATVATPRCTTAGLTIFQNLAAGTVVSVTVSGLPAACGGAVAQVTVNNGLANSSGTNTVPGGGGAVTVVLGAAVAVTAGEQTDLVLIGP
jgi:hypothetical protein